MNRPLLIAGVAVLCLPMVFATWLLLAVHWKKMDGLTMKMPMAFWGMVADITLQKHTPEATIRAVKLDPEAPQRVKVTALVPRGHATGGVVSTQPYSVNGRRIDATRFAQTASKAEAAGNYCAAEDDYANAAFEVEQDDSSYIYSEQMGKTAWLCGSVTEARHGFETAVTKEERYLKSGKPDQDETYEVRFDLVRDNEWLVLVYDKVEEKDLAKRACAVSHPGWKSCKCSVNGKGNNIACIAG